MQLKHQFQAFSINIMLHSSPGLLLLPQEQSKWMNRLRFISHPPGLLTISKIEIWKSKDPVSWEWAKWSRCISQSSHSLSKGSSTIWGWYCWVDRSPCTHVTWVSQSLAVSGRWASPGNKANAAPLLTQACQVTCHYSYHHTTSQSRPKASQT